MLVGLSSLVERFESLPDPRQDRNRKHRLVDVIVIAVCAVMSGCDGPTAIRLWSEEREDWLRQYLELPNGLPSKDCLRRVLILLNPDAFAQCFGEWVAEELSSGGEGRLIAIDGKTLRRSHDRKKGLGALHMVSAWASEEGLSLGQLATEEKSNEITAIPELIDKIDVKGAIVTIDAMGCQKEIAGKIVDSGGDYVLALKGNHQTLHKAVGEHFDALHENGFEGTGCRRHETSEKGHGRQEQRYYLQTTLPKELKHLTNEWPGLKSIGQAISVTERDGKEYCDVRYYISSLKPSVKRFGNAVRRHWAIENTLHWTLDVTFREDESRTRERQLASNLAALRRFAVGLLKRHPTKHSLRNKQRIAAWSTTFLAQVLGLERA